MIRRAVREDAAALAAFGARTFADAFAAANRPDDMAAYLEKNYGESKQRREIEDPKVATLLVEDDGLLIGFAQIRCAGESFEIARFYGEQRFHGRGVAQELMQATLAAARSLGAKEIWLGVWEKNAKAIRFYRKAGFEDVGSQPFVLGSDLQIDRVMLRPL